MPHHNTTYEMLAETYDPDRVFQETLDSREHLNIAEEALRSTESDVVAIRRKDFSTGGGGTERYTFGELASAANQVANYLDSRPGGHTCVGTLLQPSIELYSALYGTILSGRIYVPLAPVYGIEALNHRIQDAGISLLWTTTEMYARVREQLSDEIEVVVLVDDGEPELGSEDSNPTIDRRETVEQQDTAYAACRTHPTDVYTIRYTSGTTGKPKGITTAHREFYRLHAYLEYVIDLRSTDEYFVAASPAWNYGLLLGTIAANVRDTAIGSYRGEFSPRPLLETLDDFGVTNAMIPPTALRQIKNSEIDPAEYDIDLRILLSIGESLDESTSEWAESEFGVVPLDAYGFSEDGRVLVSNYPFSDWDGKAGSIGKPLPGIEIDLLDEDGNRVAEGEIGELAVKREPDSLQRYWSNEHRTATTFSGPWLRSGDLVRKDEDGYFWFVSRKDELIISSGHRIGPEEVEETLTEHEAVREAGVIGVPDDTRGNVVKAYISLITGVEPSEELKAEIVQFTKNHLSKYAYPRRLEIVDELPKTVSDKIDRAALRERTSEAMH